MKVTERSSRASHAANRTPSVLVSTIANLMATASFLGAAPVIAAPAAQALEEVVVTARRREEQIQDVPIAITALSGAALEKGGLTSTEDLRFVAPSLQISPSPFGSSVPGYTLRGQRQLESIATQDPSVMIYFADTAMMRPHGTNGSFYDLANVQVLKGPQGTLFGRNTTGGAVLINPERPNADGVSGKIGVTVGNYNLRATDGAINLPVTDTVSLRLAGRVEHRDGFTKNLFDGDYVDDADTRSYRVGLLWQPTAALENYTVAQTFKSDNSGQGWRLSAVNPNSAVASFPGVIPTLQSTLSRLDGDDWHTVFNDGDLHEKVDTWNVTNITTWDLGGVTLKNIAGYREVDSDVGMDYDGSPARVISPVAGNLGVFNSINEVDAEQLSNELQVLGTSFDERLEWITGLFWFKEKVFDNQVTELFGRRTNTGTATNESSSVFAQGTWRFSDEFSVTAGYRHTWDERELVSANQIQPLTQPALGCRLTDANGAALDPCRRVRDYDDNAGTWLVSADYKVTPDTLLYVATRHGYRSGGLQLRANRADEVSTFEPEFVDDIEIGVKSTFDIGGVASRLNAALFYQKYEDIQRTLSFIPPGQTALTTVVLNAGKATIQGGEVELTIIPFDALELSAFVGYTDARYDEFDNPGIAGQPASLKNNDFAMVPEVSAGATIIYTLPLPTEVGDISAQLNWYTQSEMEMTDINEPSSKIGRYDLFNFYINWDNMLGSALSTRLFAKNLTDEEYATGGTSIWTTGFASLTLGAPRTYGVELRYQFGN
jgi:iron complex outermembrane receptor protein